jgi:hypothetical protein
MDIAVELCTGGSIAFAVGGLGYHYFFRRRQNEGEQNNTKLSMRTLVEIISLCAERM